jgi:hypothetical protein
MNCVLDNGVRILSRSRGQKIRGLKHRQHRPSLVIADDVEDLDWVRTQENRDKSDRWMRGNVLPSIDERDGRMVIIGNWLHTDGLMARLKATGIFKVLEFPLFREGDGTELSAAPGGLNTPPKRSSTASGTSWGISASAARCSCRSCLRKGRTFIQRIFITMIPRHSMTVSVERDILEGNKSTQIKQFMKSTIYLRVAKTEGRKGFKIEASTEPSNTQL